jgi:hypothetical protein
MKTNVYEAIEITDDERRMLADLLDSERSKRMASRDEIKKFCWDAGSGWNARLHAEHAEEFGAPEGSAGTERHLAAVPDPQVSEAFLETSADDLEPGPPLPPATWDSPASVFKDAAPIDLDDLI